MPGMPDFQYDVFLSYSSADKPRVRRLAQRLSEAAGLHVWFDEWVIQPGDDIFLAVERGLQASRTLVLCLSPKALGSDWVTLERSAALFRDPANTRRRFIPILLTDCNLPDTLRRYKYVDYRDESEVSFEQLLRSCSPQEEQRISSVETAKSLNSVPSVECITGSPQFDSQSTTSLTSALSDSSRGLTRLETKIQANRYVLEDLVRPVVKRLVPDVPRWCFGGVRRKIVRDAVWGMIDLEPHEVLILNTPLFQRLRGISQTGFTYFVYPCAVHSRFEHSLGALCLSGRVIDALMKRHGQAICTRAQQLTVRLAALLHDISHCVFSHVSEPVYGQDRRVKAAREKLRALFPLERRKKLIGAAEVITYAILTSKRFRRFFEQVRKAVGEHVLPKDVDLADVARLIVGLPPKDAPNHLFLVQIINGPFDIDKLDYQARDGYFTGIRIPVDIERLLASMCVFPVNNELNLAIDHRGIAPIEQLLFNRMMLYDSVYHHHKNRAAVQLFKTAVNSPEKLPLEWLLRHDEYDFYGCKRTPSKLKPLIERLRKRDLPFRAVVIHPTTINRENTVNRHSNTVNPLPENEVWGRIMSMNFSADPKDKEMTSRWVAEVKSAINEELEGKVKFYVDFPDPPGFIELQQGTYVWYSDDNYVPMEHVFPITSALNSYAQQCKYRTYVFADREMREKVAAAAYKVLKKKGVQLNQEAFRLAQLDPQVIARLAGEAIPPRLSP